MQRILFALFTFMPIINSLIAIEVKNEVRILELLPNLLCPLSVDPGIPADFIALSPNGNLDLCDWIYWGREDVLKAYFINQESLEEPIIRVKLSGNTAQTGSNTFNNESSKVTFKKMEKDFSEVQPRELYWGDYPVHTVKLKGDNYIFIAWVGLNDKEAGWTLLFNLIYPEKPGHPNKMDDALWENLLKKTTPLEPKDNFKVCGQDLQEGYTLVNTCGTKLKMLAEKRQSDGLLQVVVIPEDADVEFQCVDLVEGLMGSTWKYGEPLLKVYGKIVNPKAHCVTDCVTSIFFKNVLEFSFKKEEEKDLLIFQKLAI